MKTVVLQGVVLSDAHKKNLVKRYMLRRFHPRALLLDSVGFMWFTYLFWLHQWEGAVTAFVVFKILAMSSTFDVDPDAIGSTRWGKLALLHLSPMNLALQSVGLVALIYGIWEHSTTLILGGLSFILMGHLSGWGKVDPRLRG